MAIEVELPDGTVVEFPDGTDRATMERALAQYAQQQPARPKRPAPVVDSAEIARKEFQALPWWEQALVAAGGTMDSAIDGVKQIFTDDDSEYGRRLQAEIDAKRPYLNATSSTAAGFVGGIAPYLIPIPGASLASGAGRLARLANNPIARSATGGALVGSLESTATGESRAANAGIGALAGVGGVLVPRLTGTAVRTAGAAIAPFTQKGQERIAARVLKDSAVDPLALTRSAPSAIPGVQRTLAEETADPGIAQLQRQFSAQLQPRAAANNAARAKAIRETFEGADDAAAMSIKGERDRAAAEALRGLRTAGFVERRPIQQALEAAIKRHQGNPATQKALQDVLAEMPEIRTAEQAYNFRKYIDFVLSKQSDKPAARQAARELQTVKDLIDRSMSRAFPEWRSYLRDYRAASTRADQAKVGTTLLDRARAATDPVTGERMFTPAELARVAGDPDALVRTATRFPKARADRTLTPQQSGLLRALYDDASRMDAAANAGRAVGSNTAQNLATQNILRTVGGGSPLLNLLLQSQPAQRLTAGVERAYGVFGVPARLQEVLVEALENPQRAREIIARLPDPDRVLIEQAIGRYAGKAAPAIAGVKRGSPIEIAGGQPGPWTAEDEAEYQRLRREMEALRSQYE